jgi:hypothetical protein
MISRENRLRVDRYTVVCDPPDNDSYAATDLAVPIIDGIPLFEMLHSSFPGVPIGLVVPPSRHWLDDPDPSYVDDAEGRPAILDGSCGIAECCGVMARIELTSSTVAWTDFVARGRGSIPLGLEFVFDRDHYETAIARVREVVPADWTDEV